jgi:hypothetical protein
MEQIEKNLKTTIDKIDSFFNEKYYQVNFDHIAIDKAVAKTIHNEKGFYFEVAKMILTTQKDAKVFFDNDDKKIEFGDLYTKLYFKINQCGKINFEVKASGSTDLKGYIKDFTTNHIDNYLEGVYRAVIITKEKFTVSSYFYPSKLLKVNNTIHGSGVIEISINDISIQLYSYDDKITKKIYFIIETTSKCSYDKFVDILDDIILSITYLTGFFLGESIFVLGSDNMNFRKNELLCLKSFNEELKDGITTIPQIKFQIEVTGTNDLTSPKVIALLSEEISKNLVYKRTILLLCQAHSEPHYVKATLYSNSGFALCGQFGSLANLSYF